MAGKITALFIILPFMILQEGDTQSSASFKANPHGPVVVLLVRH
jgi:hypothetical protein